MAYWRLHYHLVWTTLQRQALITDQKAQLIAQTVHRKAREFGVTIHELGGTENHIHIVASIPPRVAVADCLHQFKGASSYAVNTATTDRERFRWQDGYGAVTVGPRALARVIDYVRCQRQHHATGTLIPALERCAPAALPHAPRPAEKPSKN